MSSQSLNQLIDGLAAEAAPVEPLRAPWQRALTILAPMALIGILVVVLLSKVDPLAARRPGEHWLAVLEMIAMFATGALAIVAAFHFSIPGRSRKWIAAPLPAFAAWLTLSGIGCYRDLVRRGPAGWELGHSMDCLLFILAASLLIVPPLLWRLSRARPIDPLPVALLAALGAAAFSAMLLQFFHPFAVTFIDLAVHLAAVCVVIGLAAAVSRSTLRPA
jgi:hypothetical protein